MFKLFNCCDPYYGRKWAKYSARKFTSLRNFSIAEKGSYILGKVQRFNLVSQIVREHHERWDGKGYPDGLRGEQILFGTRIIAVADSIDAILNEATSPIDTVTEQKIRRAMYNIGRDRTSFIIAHRLSTIRDSDIIIVIEDGEITEKGTHDELLAIGGHYARLYKKTDRRNCAVKP